MRHVQREQRSQTVPRSAERHALPDAQQRQQPRRARCRFPRSPAKTPSTSSSRRAGTTRSSASLRARSARSICVKITVPIGRATNASAKNRERIERARQRIDKRKHELRKHDDRRNGVDEEVEKLRRAPHDDTDRDLGRLQRTVMVVQASRIALERGRMRASVCAGWGHVCSFSGSTDTGSCLASCTARGGACAHWANCPMLSQAAGRYRSGPVTSRRLAHRARA